MFQDQDYNGNYDQLQTNKQSIIHLRNYKLWLTSLQYEIQNLKLNLKLTLYTVSLHSSLSFRIELMIGR